MIKIGLFCAAGFSTGMLVNNMKVAAEKRGIDCQIEAYSQGKLADYAPQIDVALLGPQVSYTLESSEAICQEHGVPIAVIPMADYGMLDGEKVLDLALSLVKR
ncbi:PTS sugar transporter subunit IIB [Streptococcus pseudoporcinus]|uniref:PTS system cellobiose-specific transporter subunit IIB n=1 Tax=Streptococcus pseudoporcinus TaxID=361101 RepID=A0A4U9XHD6_9STRE|nr:PTS sugar transporter subunit IIB [Streptococcus pseudoporcinus]VTS12379.1 PTS system cellobiose-specific transporter subunit IIB [Streptococcus pseudoporcinus]VUC64905.1 PTS system cellobiose-specific transporter subunit IIB [Streptococcus pseudoporcinus]VUC95416.1 PTS system cellobiose-specific transporter subunit IIB [Streptococcus pseudoporcinus]VUC95811.1 PTS system cellobiose-specific transporter subunit IIB [Streptococcus pseudoporcinus]